MKHSFYWMNPKVEPKASAFIGNGLFAKTRILKDERILIIGGYIMTVGEESQLPNKYSDNGVQIAENLVIGVTNENEWGGVNYLNHHCNPNAGFKGQIFLDAMRDINIDEEITIDYAMVLYQSEIGIPYKLNCLCGDVNCRKVITDNDWKIPLLQKKYKGYFQHYLEEKITKLDNL